MKIADGNQRITARISTKGVDQFVQSGWDIVTKMDDVGKRTYYTGMSAVSGGSSVSASGSSSGSSAVESEDSVKYFHYNHRGDTVLVTDANGEILHNLNYEAYGKPTNNEGIPINPLTLKNTTAPTSGSNNLPNLFVGASGIRYDTKTNLHYMRFRWFSGEQMRFISPDLIMGINRYSYVSGNPVKYFDPMGLWKFDFESIERYGAPRPGWKPGAQKDITIRDIFAAIAESSEGYSPPLSDKEALKEFWKHYVKENPTNQYKHGKDLYRDFKIYDDILNQIDQQIKPNAYSLSGVVTVPLVPPLYVGGGCEMVCFKDKVRYYAFPVISIASGPSNSISINVIQHLKSFDQIPGFYYSGSFSPGLVEFGAGTSNGPNSFNNWSFGINPTFNKNGGWAAGGGFDVRYYVDITNYVAPRGRKN